MFSVIIGGLLLFMVIFPAIIVFILLAILFAFIAQSKQYIPLILLAVRKWRLINAIEQLALCFSHAQDESDKKFNYCEHDVIELKQYVDALKFQKTEVVVRRMRAENQELFAEIDNALGRKFSYSKNRFIYS